MTPNKKQSQKTPGFCRRIIIDPKPGHVAGALEDDVHRFRISISHNKGLITDVKATADRFPYTTCADAGAFMAEQTVGRPLSEIKSLDVLSHCTHLYDLAVLCATHANDQAATQFDIFVADREGTKTFVTLTENGKQVLRWDVNETTLEGPRTWAGRELRKLSKWKSELDPADLERALMMRRALFVSGVRRLTAEQATVERASDRGPERAGVCFTHQMPRALNAFQTPEKPRDFSLTEDEPLQDISQKISGKAAGVSP